MCRLRIACSGLVGTLCYLLITGIPVIAATCDNNDLRHRYNFIISTDEASPHESQVQLVDLYADVNRCMNLEIDHRRHSGSHVPPFEKLQVLAMVELELGHLDNLQGLDRSQRTYDDAQSIIYGLSLKGSPPSIRIWARKLLGTYRDPQAGIR